jgi:hypothetical protein
MTPKFGGDARWSGTEGRHHQTYIGLPNSDRSGAPMRTPCPAHRCKGTLAVHTTFTKRGTKREVKCNTCSRVWKKTMLIALGININDIELAPLPPNEKST